MDLVDSVVLDSVLWAGVELPGDDYQAFSEVEGCGLDVLEVFKKLVFGLKTDQREEGDQQKQQELKDSPKLAQKSQFLIKLG